MLDAKPGPHRVEERVHFVCGVPRFRGDVSAARLSLAIGNEIMISSPEIVENSDKTQSLTISQWVHMTTALDGERVTCTFTQAFNDIQIRSFVIHVFQGMLYGWY